MTSLNQSWLNNALKDSRKRTDPLSDNFVSELAKTKSKLELYAIMEFLLDEFVWLGHEQMDESIENYIKTASVFPDWVDNDLLLQGQKFFAVHGFEISMMLLMKSLPATYCCWRGAEVVHATGRMTNHSGNLKPFTRRLMQTSKFVLNVCSPDAMSANGVGVKASVKVRTLHAFVRYFLKSKHWDSEQLGEPINQEDAAGTMLSFSVFVIEGLESLGIKVSDKEKEAYYHVWRLVSHLMGVEEQLAPENYKQASLLGHAIINEQKGSSEIGKELTGACLDFMKDLIPFRIFKFLPANMMHFLIGPELSAMVGIKKTRNIFLSFAFFMFRMVIHFYEFLKSNFKWVENWAIKNNPKFLNAIICKFLEETGKPFSPHKIEQEVQEIKS